MADIFKDNENDPQIAIAHRQELTLQISMALASVGLHQRIIAADRTIKLIVERHIAKFGQSFYHPGAPTAVAGIDTLNQRLEDLTPFLRQVKRWQTDEAHHLQINNKWGAPLVYMPNAFGIGWTATPMRPTGQSLGRSLSGVFDQMRIGPSMRELINRGYLCEYRIIAPPLAMSTEGVNVSSSTGDFNQNQLRNKAHREKSKIIGDVVGSYQQFAAGKRNVVFAVDVEIAEETAAAFVAAGISAAVLHGKTPAVERIRILDQFEAGIIRVIVNVDVLGEGFDCPAIECVQMARPTDSYGLYVQQFGRALRILLGKSHGIIIDHVGNVERHGLPDTPRAWSLEGTAKRPRRLDDDLPIRVCRAPGCFHVFESYGRTCPKCGHCPPRESAGRPDMVEGDLIEFSPELLAKLRREAAAAVRDLSNVKAHVLGPNGHFIKRNHGPKRDAQLVLREAISLWAGTRLYRYSDPDSDSYRRFFRTFGTDVATAQTLGANDAQTLTAKVWDDLGRMKRELGE